MRRLQPQEISIHIILQKHHPFYWCLKRVGRVFEMQWTTTKRCSSVSQAAVKLFTVGESTECQIPFPQKQLGCSQCADDPRIKGTPTKHEQRTSQHYNKEISTTFTLCISNIVISISCFLPSNAFNSYHNLQIYDPERVILRTHRYGLYVVYVPLFDPPSSRCEVQSIQRRERISSPETL